MWHPCIDKADTRFNKSWYMSTVAAVNIHSYFFFCSLKVTNKMCVTYCRLEANSCCSDEIWPLGGSDFLCFVLRENIFVHPYCMYVCVSSSIHYRARSPIETCLRDNKGAIKSLGNGSGDGDGPARCDEVRY